ncbi:10607_t:CDS:1, partial [Racocetra fulgida]
PQLQIVWILIGIPAKVGYFSSNTRKIKILSSGLSKFASELNANNYFVELKVPKNLPRNSVIITSFICPSSNYEPNFIAKLYNQQDNKILVKIRYLDSDKGDDENEYNSNDLLSL